MCFAWYFQIFQAQVVGRHSHSCFLGARLFKDLLYYPGYEAVITLDEKSSRIWSFGCNCKPFNIFQYLIVALIILVGYASIQDFYVPIANKPIVWVESANFYRRQEALNIVDIASRLQDVDVSSVGS